MRGADAEEAVTLYGRKDMASLADGIRGERFVALVRPFTSSDVIASFFVIAFDVANGRY